MLQSERKLGYFIYKYCLKVVFLPLASSKLLSYRTGQVLNNKTNFDPKHMDFM